MSTRLSAQPPAADPAYELKIIAQSNTIDVQVTAQGEPAARGKAALTGEFAVVDQVVTEPDHRRRGLGTTVMRALYRNLGWTLQSPMTAAVSRG